jgi:formate hydrogenlyase subunit 6/NADH:ubiquinone oxidoreductase subunit I
MARLSPILREALAHIFKKPATQRYPEVKPKVSSGFRGKQTFNINLCSCPRGAIKSSEIFELASADKSDLVVKPKEEAANKVG